MYQQEPKALTVEEIKMVTKMLGETDGMAEVMGYDADQYVGNFDGRIRFLLEIVDSIKRNVGSSLPLVVKRLQAKAEFPSSLETNH